MAELAYAEDLKSSVSRHAGSTPAAPTSDYPIKFPDKIRHTYLWLLRSIFSIVKRQEYCINGEIDMNEKMLKQHALICCSVMTCLALSACAPLEDVSKVFSQELSSQTITNSAQTHLDVSDSMVSTNTSSLTSDSSNIDAEMKKLQLQAPIKVSNIVSDEDKAFLKKLLSSANIDEALIKSTLDRISAYNEQIGAENLISGTAETSDVRPLYNVAELYNKLDSTRGEFIGNNCRMTTFEIMSKFMSNPLEAKDRPDYLFIDYDALASKKGITLSDEELKKFDKIYASILTENSKDEQVHSRKILEDYAARNINFTPSQASIISVYMHSHFDGEPDYLFVGHTGILFPYEGQYVFFEKVSFDEPYQLVYVKDKAQLKEYLLAKYDDSDTQETSAPLIFENNQVMQI